MKKMNRPFVSAGPERDRAFRRASRKTLFMVGGLLLAVLAIASCSSQPKPKTAAKAPSAVQKGNQGTSSAASASPNKGSVEGENAGPLALEMMHETESPAAAAEAAKKAKAKVLADRYPKPPNGKWLTDKQGREYFLQKFPRIKGRYTWANSEHTRVRYWHGVTIDIDHYDANDFYVKVFRVKPNAGGAPPAPPSAAELAKVAATYPGAPPTERRWRVEPFDKGLPRRGQWRNGFAIADMNGDGHPDIVSGPSRKGKPVPVIFLGDGKGDWKPWAQAQFPPAMYAYGDAAVADFNGDGHPDLALGVHLRGAIVLVGDGKGHFSTWSKGIRLAQPGVSKAATFTTRRVAVVDWNRDGRPDLLALSEGPGGIKGFDHPTQYGPVVFLNQGDGSWKEIHQDAEAPVAFGDDLALADFNRDGWPDFVTGLSVEGDGDALYLGSKGGKLEAKRIAGFRPTAVELGVAAADFDGDGRPDLAVAYSNDEYGVTRSGIDLLFNRAGEKGAIDWQREGLAAGKYADGFPIFTALAAGDVDGDGRPDLVALTGDGQVWVFRNRGEERMVREELPELAKPAPGCRGYHAALADLDGDGRDDEIVVEQAGDRCPGGGSIRAWRVVPR